MLVSRPSRNSSPARISLEVAAATAALAPMRAAVEEALARLGIDERPCTRACVGVASEIVAAMAVEYPDRPLDLDVARRGTELELTVSAPATDGNPIRFDGWRGRVVEGLGAEPRQHVFVDDHQIRVWFDTTTS